MSAIKQEDSDTEIVIKTATNPRKIRNKGTKFDFTTNPYLEDDNNEWKWDEHPNNTNNKKNNYTPTNNYSDYEDSDESVNTTHNSKSGSPKKKISTKNKTNKAKSPTKSKTKTNKAKSPTTKKTKKKPTNSNKKWTEVQDRVLLKWMHKNPNQHRNTTKIAGLAGGTLRRSTTAVVSRIALLKKSINEQEQNPKQKHIKTNSNNNESNDETKNTKKRTKKSKKRNREKTEDFQRICNVLEKLNNGYDVERSFTGAMLTKVKNEGKNMNINNCKEMTGFNIEYWENKLKCVEENISKIPLELNRVFGDGNMRKKYEKSVIRDNSVGVAEPIQVNKDDNGRNKNNIGNAFAEIVEARGNRNNNDDNSNEDNSNINGYNYDNCNEERDKEMNECNIKVEDTSGVPDDLYIVNGIIVDPNDLLTNPYLCNVRDVRPRKRRKLY